MPLDFTLPEIDMPWVYDDWAEPDEKVIGIDLDVYRATKEYLFSTGRYENPDDVWESIPYPVKFAAVQYTKRILVAALGGDPEKVGHGGSL